MCVHRAATTTRPLRGLTVKNKTGRAASGADGIREEREVAAVPRVSLLLLASFLARLATHREGQRMEPPLSNLTLAFDAEAIFAGVEPDERLVDAGQSFRPHLEECELDLSLDVGVGVFEVVPHVFRSLVSAIANAILHVIVHRASSLGEHVPQIGVAAGGISHVRLPALRRMHEETTGRCAVVNTSR